MPVLELKNATIAYGRKVVLDVDYFCLFPGEIFTVAGPNGAGKSTLLKAVLQLTRPVSGSLTFQGALVRTGKELLKARRSMAMVFQEPLLFNTSVYENVASGLRIRGESKRSIEQRVSKYLEIFGIAHLRDRSAVSLSGGEAQRTSLARALVVEPKVLLLDEPFSSLDPIARDSLLSDLIPTLQRENIATLMTTHDRQEISCMASRIGILRDGRFVQVGKAEDVIRKPCNDFVRSLLGMSGGRLPTQAAESSSAEFS